MNFEIETVFFMSGLFVAATIGCVALGVWIVWEFTGISKRLKKW